MSLDRSVLAFAGTMVLLSVLLTWTVSVYFLWFTVFIGLNMIQSAFTGFCPAAYRLPPPRREARNGVLTMRRMLLTGVAALASHAAFAATTLKLAPVTLPEWKAVYAQVETRTTVPARARIGGTITELEVAEGDTVKTGEVIALVHDEKLDFQIQAIDAQLKALQSQLANARTDLGRAEQLVGRGVTTAQQLDQLRTQVAVYQNQMASTEAQRSVVEQQQKEGRVLAPFTGRVLTVPVTRDAVIMAGEPVAVIGGGGFFLRLSIPERHAASLKQGAKLEIVTEKGSVTGTLAKIYPLIANGRVTADVEVPDLQTTFVDSPRPRARAGRRAAGAGRAGIGRRTPVGARLRRGESRRRGHRPRRRARRTHGHRRHAIGRNPDGASPR